AAPTRARRARPARDRACRNAQVLPRGRVDLPRWRAWRRALRGRAWRGGPVVRRAWRGPREGGPHRGPGRELRRGGEYRRNLSRGGRGSSRRRARRDPGGDAASRARAGGWWRGRRADRTPPPEAGHRLALVDGLVHGATR